jgi:YfiH family protein
MILYESKLFIKHNYLTGTTDLELNFKKNSEVFENSKSQLSEYLNKEKKDYLALKQIHSNIILEEPYINPSETEGDGIILKNSSKYGVIKTADCLPIVICDPNINVVILLHVGRKGARDGIINKSLKIFKDCYNSKINQLIVYLGPCLLFEDHIVFEEEKEGFGPKYFKPLPKGMHIINNKQLYDDYCKNRKNLNIDIKQKNSGYFDLKGFALDELLNFGILISNIDDCKINTFHNSNCHSYRRDYPDNGLSATYCSKKYPPIEVE